MASTQSCSFPGWCFPDRLLRAVWPTDFPYNAPLPFRRVGEGTASWTACRAEIYKKLGLSLSTKAVFLPGHPHARAQQGTKIYYDFEDGRRRTDEGDFIQAYIDDGGPSSRLLFLNTGLCVLAHFRTTTPWHFRNPGAQLTGLGRKILAGEDVYVSGNPCGPNRDQGHPNHRRLLRVGDPLIVPMRPARW
eukprot:jgi/Botrbrau1/3612/Bobra.0204s0008.1